MSDRTVGGFEQRRAAADLDGLSDASEVQAYSHVERVVDSELEVGGVDFESGFLGGELVLAGKQERDEEGAAFIGCGRGGDSGLQIPGADLRAHYDGVRGVDGATHDRGAGFLRGRAGPSRWPGAGSKKDGSNGLTRLGAYARPLLLGLSISAMAVCVARWERRGDY